MIRQVHAVSIHAPRVGGDVVDAASWPLDSMFQSTPPAWGATLRGPSMVHQPVSIHAPRVGGDVLGALALGRIAFQSTPPAWGATADVTADRENAAVSIHAPRVGGDDDAETPLWTR